MSLKHSFHCLITNGALQMEDRMLAMSRPPRCWHVGPSKTGGYCLLRLIVLLCKGSHAPSLNFRASTKTTCFVPTVTMAANNETVKGRGGICLYSPSFLEEFFSKTRFPAYSILRNSGYSYSSGSGSSGGMRYTDTLCGGSLSTSYSSFLELKVHELSRPLQGYYGIGFLRAKSWTCDSRMSDGPDPRYRNSDSCRLTHH